MSIYIMIIWPEVFFLTRTISIVYGIKSLILCRHSCQPLMSSDSPLLLGCVGVSGRSRLLWPEGIWGYTPRKCCYPQLHITSSLPHGAYGGLQEAAETRTCHTTFTHLPLVPGKNTSLLQVDLNICSHLMFNTHKDGLLLLQYQWEGTEMDPLSLLNLKS